MRLLVSFLELW